MSQQKSLKEQLVGTWILVSWEQVRPDGVRFQRFGINPKGIHVFDGAGRFYVMLSRANLPMFALRDPMQATPNENRAVMEGAIAYYGTYMVDEANKSIVLRVEASTFPNQIGSEQKRTIASISGGDLKITNQGMTGQLITYVMKRATKMTSN